MSHRPEVVAMGKKAREKVEKKYGVDAYYQRLMAAYGRVVNTSRPAMAGFEDGKHG
jgi:hypothetical protein